MTCWQCNAQSIEECASAGYEQRCNDGDVCFLEIRERREARGRSFTQIAMGCKQEQACENNKANNFNQQNVDYTQCKPEAHYTESVCRQCCAEKNCVKEPSWWIPASREEWAYPDSPVYVPPGGNQGGYNQSGNTQYTVNDSTSGDNYVGGAATNTGGAATNTYTDDNANGGASYSGGSGYKK